MSARHSIQLKLSTKPVLLGFAQVLPNPVLSEMAGLCGYDFLILDGEHGIFSEMDYLQTFLAVGSTDMAAIVRLRGHDVQAIGHYLDMGAHGIIAPNVATADQAKALVRAMHYPPAGTRGFAAPAHRMSRYGSDLVAHIKSPRDGVFLAVLIESVLGVSNLEEILAVEGVDAAVIGPFDLTADMGSPGDFSLPAYAEAVNRIERVAIERGRILGFGLPGCTPDVLVKRGHRMIAIGHDVVSVREMMAAQLAKAKACL